MSSTVTYYRRTDSGYTLVEMLVVLAIAGVLVAVVLSGFSSFRNYFTLRAAVQDTHTALIDARGATLASKNDTVHGVHVDAGQVVRFQGASYSAGATTNIAFPFPPNVTASASLAGGGSDIIFTRLTGATTKSGTITLTETRGGQTAVITIASSGTIAL